MLQFVYKVPSLLTVSGGLIHMSMTQRLLSQLSRFLLIAMFGTLILFSQQNVEIVKTQLQNSPNRFNILYTDSVWNSISSEFTLVDRNIDNAQVQAEIRKLLADREHLNHILQNARPYIYYIHAETKQRGLPSEIALIPFIESEFSPNDHSNKGALGLWQLMSGTAHELGVQIKSDYDGRRNVVSSTRAALAYFHDLGGLFKGNWYLAIAAYNCGQMRVLNTVHRTGSQTFWGMPLPRETQLYVPKLLAVAAIIKNPEKYGVVLPPISNEPYFSTLQTEKSVRLETVAKSSGIDLVELKKLNPDYKSTIPASVGKHTLLVPAASVNQVTAHIPQLSSTTL